MLIDNFLKVGVLLYVILLTFFIIIGDMIYPISHEKIIKFIAIAHFMILRLFTAGSIFIISFSCLFLLLKLSRSLIFSFEAPAQA